MTAIYKTTYYQGEDNTLSSLFLFPFGKPAPSEE